MPLLMLFVFFFNFAALKSISTLTADLHQCAPVFLAWKRLWNVRLYVCLWTQIFVFNSFVCFFFFVPTSPSTTTMMMVWCIHSFNRSVDPFWDPFVWNVNRISVEMWQLSWLIKVFNTRNYNTCCLIVVLKIAQRMGMLFLFFAKMVHVGFTNARWFFWALLLEFDKSASHCWLNRCLYIFVSREKFFFSVRLP